MPILRVKYPTKDVIHAINSKGCLGDVGFAVDNCTGMEERLDKRSIFGGWMLTKRGDTNSAIVAAYVKGIFDGDGEAVKRAKRCAGDAKMVVKELSPGESEVEEGFSEAESQLMGYCCSLGAC